MSLLAVSVPGWELFASGDFVDLQMPTPLHQVVRPVVRVVDGGLPEVAGSAVHLSAAVPTALVTARHVFHRSFTDPKYKGRDVTLWVSWRSDTVNAVQGDLVQVVYYEDQAAADLATLSLVHLMPEQAVGSTFPLSLRMPRVGERVAVVGYPGPSAADGVHTDDASAEACPLSESHLRVSVGRVTQLQPERLDIHYDNTRAAPGFYADAPTTSGMSGGAVLDEGGSLVGLLSRSSDDGHVSRSYVALAADMLGLLIRVPVVNEPESYTEGPVEAMLGAGKIEYTVDRSSFAVEDGVPVYSNPAE